jgi:hypothetical protein
VDGFLGAFEIFLLLSLHHGTRKHLHGSLQIISLILLAHINYLFIMLSNMNIDRNGFRRNQTKFKSQVQGERSLSCISEY